MSTFAVPGAEIYFEVIGTQGEWVLLINGHTRSSSDFKVLARKLSSLGYRCLCFDNRGSGQTISHRDFTFEDLVADVDGLLGNLRINQFRLVGISMGGLIAQAVAAAAGERVAKLILVSTYCDRTQLPAEQKPWGQSLETIREKLHDYFAPTFVDRNDLLVTAMAKQIFKSIQSGQYLQNSARQRAAMDHFDPRDIHRAAIKSPTLILHGSEDQIINQEAAPALAREIAGATIKIYPGAGHLLLAECPGELYDDIIDFLGQP